MSIQDNDLIFFGKEYLSAFHKKLMISNNVKILFSGDSTTECNLNSPNYKIDSLISFLSKRTGFGHLVTALNRGHAGKSTIDWINLYLSSDLAENPDLYIIRWGINDPYAPINKTVAQSIEDLRNGLTTIRASKTTAQMSILLMTPNATYDVNFPGGADACRTWHEEMNPLIKQAARDFQCCFIDTYSLFKDAQNANDWMLDTDPKNVHPADVMNGWISGEIFKVIFPPIWNNSVYLEPTNTPILTNGWINYGIPYPNVGYYKSLLGNGFIYGIVYLRGCVKNGTSNQSIFNLPPGYRPSGTIVFPVLSGGNIGFVTISATGDVTCISGNSISVFLDGINFRAEN